MIIFNYKKTKFASDNPEKVWKFVKQWTVKNKRKFKKHVQKEKGKDLEQNKHTNMINFYLEHTSER